LEWGSGGEENGRGSLEVGEERGVKGAKRGNLKKEGVR